MNDGGAFSKIYDVHKTIEMCTFGSTKMDKIDYYKRDDN